VTHFSKVLFSCKHVSAIVIICSNSQVQTVSLLVRVWVYVLALTHCSWQHSTLFAEPSAVHRQTSIYVGMFLLFSRIKHRFPLLLKLSITDQWSRYNLQARKRLMCTLSIDDHSLQMTAVSLSYNSFIFDHLR